MAHPDIPNLKGLVQRKSGLEAHFPQNEEVNQLPLGGGINGFAEFATLSSSAFSSFCDFVACAVPPKVDTSGFVYCCFIITTFNCREKKVPTAFNGFGSNDSAQTLQRSSP